MPDWRDEIRRRLAELRLEPAAEAQIVEEMAQHLNDRYEEARTRGESEETALRTALEELDEMDLLEAELRAERGRAAVSEVALGRERGRFLESVAHDVRYALRSLRAAPGYTAASVLTLALGIGACTLIFGVANAVLLRPLPFPEPDRLVTYWGTAPEKGLPVVAMPSELFRVHRARTRTMEALAAYDGAGFNLTGFGDPQRLEGGTVTADFFRVFGARALLGRTFLEGDDSPGGPDVAVLSHSLWRRLFHGRSDVVGTTLTLDGTPVTILGVMAPSFEVPNRSELWVPLRLAPGALDCWCYLTVGRMRPGATADAVSREIASISDDFWISRDPNAKRGESRFVAKPLSEHLVGSVHRPLLVLLGAVGFVVLIACANVANLTLARATARAREIAVRCCLGASTRRIAAQLLTESVLLSIVGAAAGLALAVWGVQAVRTLPPTQFPRIDEVTVDARVLLFTAGVAIATGILCGILPALRASRVDLQNAIKARGQRASATVGARRLRDTFVVVQFALSLVLLAGAGLLLRSYQRLLDVDLGYRPENVVLARLDLPWPRYGSDTVVRSFYDRLLDRIREIPEVRAVGIASRAPLSGGNQQTNVIAEGREPKPGEPVLVANNRYVSPGYFAAIGTPVLRGRGILPSDNERAPRVVVVNETLARHFWPNEAAIGKRIRYEGDTTSRGWMTIVGIVPTIKHNSVDERPDLQMWEPTAQRTHWNNTLVVRTTRSPEAIASQMRRAVAALDPTLPLYGVYTLQRAVDESLGPRRLTNAVLGGFAAVALLLAAIGIYGVIALSVNGRMREFGIRLALGAQARDVGRLVLRHGLVLAAIGVGIGLAGAAWVTRFLRGLLFGVSPVDWVTFGAVAAVLTAAALVACYLPARRATRADPIVVLRAE